MAGRTHPKATISPKKSEPSPDSIPKVIWLIITGFAKVLPKQFLLILLRSVAIFLFIAFLNFYVVAVKNEGFGPGAVLSSQQKPWIWLFNYGSNKAAFSALSFFIPLFLSSLWVQIRSEGVKAFFRKLFHTFHWTGYCVSEAGRNAMPALLFSMAVIMPFGWFMNNTLLFLTLAVGQFFGYISQNKNLTFLFSRAGWMDFQRIFRGKQTLSELNGGVGGFISLGLLLGSVFLALMPSHLLRLFSILLFVLFIGLGIFIKVRQVPPQAVAGILIFLGANLLLLRLTGRVFADDAGWQELGGNAGNYIRDPGGQMVLKNGVRPGLLGVLGSLIGSTVGTVVDFGVYVGGKTVDAVTYVGGKAVDAVTYVGGKAVDAVAATGNAINNTVGEGLRQAMGPEVWDGMWNNIEEEFTVAGGQISDAWDKTKEVASELAVGMKDAVVDGISDVWNNPGVYVETLVNGTFGTIKDTVSQGWELLTNPRIVAETIYNTGKDLVGGISAITSAVARGVWTTVTDPKKAWEFTKNFVGYENFKNAFDPNRGLIDRLSQYGLGVVKLVSATKVVKAVYGAGQVVAQNGITQTVKNISNRALDIVGRGKTASAGSTIPKFTLKGPANTRHLNPRQTRELQQLMRQHNIQEATIRGGKGSALNMRRMARGDVLPKPHDVMNKTGNAIDRLIGGPKNGSRVASHFKPTLPSAQDLAKLKPANQRRVWERYLQRFDEYHRNNAAITKLTTTPIGVRPDGSVITKLTRDANGVLRDGITGKRFGSDWDFATLTKKGGELLSKRQHDAFIQDCIRRGLPVRHGSLADWVNHTDFNREAYGSMIRDMMKDGVVSVGPDGVPTHKVLEEFLRAAPQM